MLGTRCHNAMVGVTLMDRMRNEERQRRTVIRVKLTTKVARRMFRWFGDTERTDKKQMVTMVLKAEAVRCRTRSILRFVLKDRMRKSWLFVILEPESKRV